MPLSEVFVKLYFFFLLFNVAAFMIQATLDQASIENLPNADANLPFTTQHINQSGTLFINGTNVQNDTNTIVGQIYNPLNETGDPGDIVNENSILNILTLDNAIRFIDGGFILNGFDNFGSAIGLEFPEAFKIGFAVIIGFLTFMWLIYVFLGRS